MLTRLLEIGRTEARRGESTAAVLPDRDEGADRSSRGTWPRRGTDAGAAFRALATATRWLSERARRTIALAGRPRLADYRGRTGGRGGGDRLPGSGAVSGPAEARVAPGKLLWLGLDASALPAGRALGEGINLTRRLVNEPPSVVYPETFAEHATAVANETGMAIEIWDEDRLERERMRGPCWPSPAAPPVLLAW